MKVCFRCKEEIGDENEPNAIYYEVCLTKWKRDSSGDSGIGTSLIKHNIICKDCAMKLKDSITAK